MRKLLCILALSFALPAQAQLAPDQSELAKALKDLEDAKSSGKEVSKAVEKLEEELGELQEETTALASAIQKNESALYEKETSLHVLVAEQDKKSEQLAAQQKAFSKMVSTLLQMQRIPQGALIKKDQSLEEQLRAASVAESTIHHVQEEAESLRLQYEELQKLREKVEASKAELEEERTLLLAQRKSLTQKIAARETVYGRTKSNQSAINKRIDALAKESKSMQSLLAKLEAERKKMKDIGVPQAKPTRAAIKMSKNARLPAPGKITGKFGQEKGVGETLRGITVAAAPNATVAAPESGEIAFTGPFMDYGTMIIIRHDSTHHFLIAGLANTNAAVGQKVIAGEPLGTMGKTPPKETEYYFELRKNGKPIDPMDWIGKLGK